MEIQGGRQPEKCGPGPVDRRALKKITLPTIPFPTGLGIETVATKMAWPQEDPSQTYCLMKLTLDHLDFMVHRLCELSNHFFFFCVSPTDVFSDVYERSLKERGNKFEHGNG